MPVRLLSSAPAEVAEFAAGMPMVLSNSRLSLQLNLPDCCDPDILRVVHIRHSLFPHRMQPGLS